jgi:hypothetical protein
MPVRHKNSFTSVAVTAPATVSPVLAAKKLLPEGFPPGPVAMTWPVGVTLTWHPLMSIVPPSAPGLFTGSIGVAVRTRALTVIRPSESTVTSPP